MQIINELRHEILFSHQKLILVPILQHIKDNFITLFNYLVECKMIENIYFASKI